MERSRTQQPTWTIAALFARAKLSVCGPVRWGEPIMEDSPGVYVVAIVSDPTSDIDKADSGSPTLERAVKTLPWDCRDRWLPGHAIIYIGQTTKCLHRRLQQFYRHKFGQKSPHRGGQRVLLLKGCQLWIHWSPTEQPKKAEAMMIDAFWSRAGHLPFANNVRPKN